MNQYCGVLIFLALYLGPPSSAVGQTPSTASIASNADTYIQKLLPNQNEGSENAVVFDWYGVARGLVAFDQANIDTALAGSTLISAKLRLYVEFSTNWVEGFDEIEIHRMTQSWSELGVTWHSPNDPNISDFLPGGPSWDMDSDSACYASTASAILHQNNSDHNWVEFDVTADVASFISSDPVPNFGWAIKKLNFSTFLTV